MRTTLRRSSNLAKKTTLCWYDHKTDETKEEYLSKFLSDEELDGIIRIRSEEWDALPKPPASYTHFNLEESSHKPGKRYALVRILKPGYYTQEGHESLPLLDPETLIIGNCSEVEDRVPYEDLDERHFADAMSHITDIHSLKQAILKRYTTSLPDLQPSEILLRGVAITKLKLMERRDRSTR